MLKQQQEQHCRREIHFSCHNVCTEQKKSQIALQCLCFMIVFTAITARLWALMKVNIPLAERMKFSGVLTSEHDKVCLHTWLFTWVYWTRRCVVHHWILEKKKNTATDK